MNLVISDKKTAKISPDLIGVFFEDINYGADGGIYAELLENRAFEFVDCYGDKGDYYTVFDGGYGWSAYPAEDSARLQIVSGSPVSDENPHYLRLTAVCPQAGVSNQAYSGVVLQKGESYKVSFYARAVSFLGELSVSIVKDGKSYAQGKVLMVQEEQMHYWHRYELILTAEESVSGAIFALTLAGAGTVEFDFISMMPANAVAGIFRRDAFEALKALHPAFMRFPGGCIVEGNTMANRYRFKDTLKHPEDRKSNWNRWAVHNNCPDNQFHGVFSHYNQTLGMGYYEYFLLCELIGAKALPVMNVGMACQYQSYEYMKIGSPEFDQMVQDALDLIEFANGGTDTRWGRVRADMGHPAPFGLVYLGIGNEQWQMDNTDFFARYRIFEERIHGRYPQIRLIGSAGPDVTSQHYKDAWSFYREEIKKNPNFVYAIDEHYYMPPQWFLEHNEFYDSYPRDIKVFAGEYAAHDPQIRETDVKKNNWKAALSEAAFLTGVERNADVVALSSYAPLFARRGFTQWAPDLIWMDEEHCWGTPSYYVQQLFAQYRGEWNLDLEGQAERLRSQGIYCNASVDAQGSCILKVANTSSQDIELTLQDKAGNNRKAVKQIVLWGQPEDYNSPEQPRRIAPEEKAVNDGTITVKEGAFAVIIVN